MPTISPSQPFIHVMTGEAALTLATGRMETAPERLAALFDTHHQRLYRLARRLAGDADEARDLVQETFLRAARARRVPEGRAGEEAWLVRVLVNLCRDRWRQTADRRRLTLQYEPFSPVSRADPEAALVARSMVHQALAALPPRRRAIIVMHELEARQWQTFFVHASASADAQEREVNDAARLKEARQAQQQLMEAYRRLAASPQQFSVVLIVSSVLTDPPTGDIPSHARQALEDMKNFLPFKSYRLFGTADVTHHPGSAAIARISGGDNQTFEILLTGESLTPRLIVDLMRQAQAGHVAAPRMSLTFVLRDVSGRSAAASAQAGNTLINTLVTMDTGETIVVGTSRVNGSRGLLALLTALPPAAK